MNVFETWLQSEGRLYVLECARVSGLIATAPLAWLNAPLRVRGALVLMLAFVVHGATHPQTVPNSVIEVVWTLVVEFALGAAMGLIVRFIVGTAEVAGEAISPMLGLGVAHVFDAGSHSSQTILTSIFRNASILIALATGVHRLLLEALLAGFKIVPVGTSTSLAAVSRLSGISPGRCYGGRAHCTANDCRPIYCPDHTGIRLPRRAPIADFQRRFCHCHGSRPGDVDLGHAGYLEGFPLSTPRYRCTWSSSSKTSGRPMSSDDFGEKTEEPTPEKRQARSRRRPIGTKSRWWCSCGDRGGLSAHTSGCHDVGMVRTFAIHCFQNREHSGQLNLAEY